MIYFFLPISAHDRYDVLGIYEKVSEETALNSYHYIEFNDEYYIKAELDDFFEYNIFIRIIKQVNSRMFEVGASLSKRSYFIYLQYPAFLFEGDEGNLRISKNLVGELVIYDYYQRKKDEKE